MDNNSHDHVRQRAFIDRHRYSPPPTWIALGTWKLLFWGRGSRTFREIWYQPPREEAMRVLAARGICCGLSEQGCLALVQVWLKFHALPTGIALAFEHCFSHQYEIAEGYLERRGVQRAFEHRRGESFMRRLERITQKTSMRLLLLIRIILESGAASFNTNWLWKLRILKTTSSA